MQCRVRKIDWIYFEWYVADSIFHFFVNHRLCLLLCDSRLCLQFTDESFVFFDQGWSWMPAPTSRRSTRCWASGPRPFLRGTWPHSTTGTWGTTFRGVSPPALSWSTSTAGSAGKSGYCQMTCKSRYCQMLCIEHLLDCLNHQVMNIFCTLEVKWLYTCLKTLFAEVSHCRIDYSQPLHNNKKTISRSMLYLDCCAVIESFFFL